MKKLLSLFSLCFLYIYVNGLPGLFDINIERFVFVNGSEGYLINHNLRVTKYNRSASVLSGEFEYLTEINENYDISVSIFHSSRGTSQYTRTPFRILRTNMCVFMNTTYREYAMKDMMTKSDFPRGDKPCPWEKRRYWIKDYAVVLKNIPFAKEGLWRIDMYVWKGDIIVYEVQTFLKLATQYKL